MKALWISTLLSATLMACSPNANTTHNNVASTAANPATANIQAEEKTVLAMNDCIDIKADDRRCLDFNVSYLHTNQARLNEYLIQDVRQLLQIEQHNAPSDLAKLAELYVQEKRKELKEFREDANNVGFSLNYEQTLLGQRNQIVGIKMIFSGYEGGAHGYNSTHYLNFNTATQQKLTIADIRVAGAEKALADKLKNLYQNHPVFTETSLSAEEIKTFIEKDWADSIQEAFANPDNFTFTNEGILFSFPPYAIGPYGMGEIELVLPYQEAQGLIRPEWLN